MASRTFLTLVATTVASRRNGLRLRRPEHLRAVGSGDDLGPSRGGRCSSQPMSRSAPFSHARASWPFLMTEAATQHRRATGGGVRGPACGRKCYLRRVFHRMLFKRVYFCKEKIFFSFYTRFCTFIEFMFHFS